MQEPLANLERAFSMVFTVEKQRQVHTDIGEVSRQMVYQLMLKDNKKDVGDMFSNRRKPYLNKHNLLRTYCHKPGLT